MAAAKSVLAEDFRCKTLQSVVLLGWRAVVIATQQHAESKLASRMHYQWALCHRAWAAWKVLHLLLVLNIEPFCIDCIGFWTLEVAVFIPEGVYLYVLVTMVYACTVLALSIGFSLRKCWVCYKKFSGL